MEIERLRFLVRLKLQQRRLSRASYKSPCPPPRYDTAFFRGTAWLDSLSYSDNWGPSYSRQEKP